MLILNASSAVRTYDFEEENRRITIKFKRFAPLGGAIIAMLARMATPIPVAAAHMTATSTAADTDRSLRMECKAGPCAALGIDSGPDGAFGWNGYWIALGKNLPINEPYVVTVQLPNGQPYPVNQYSNPGTLFGFTGNVGQDTDAHGDPYRLIWAGTNGPNARTDPPGRYELTIHFGPSATDAVSASFVQADHF